MASLRAALFSEGIGSGVALTDDAVLKFVASQFASGRLRLCQSVIAIRTQPSGDPATSSGSNAASPQTEKPFPLADRSQQKTQSSAPPQDQSSFPSDVRLVSLAQVLKDASSSGVPFCEECLKAAFGA